MNYFWVRIFIKTGQDDECTDSKSHDKGGMIDEYYLFGENLTRDEAKRLVKERNGVNRFAKLRSGEAGTYAIVMDSSKNYYDYFAREVDDVCFHCHKQIKGKAKLFPKEMVEEEWRYL
ncbi:MAG: hypothetical protein LBM69_05165, partial [Lachnospiraceae bacterium]|nr:hypothetical protein [Lachnospiraceae bacterium]